MSNEIKGTLQISGWVEVGYADGTVKKMPFQSKPADLTAEQVQELAEIGREERKTDGDHDQQ